MHFPKIPRLGDIGNLLVILALAAVNVITALYSTQIGELGVSVTLLIVVGYILLTTIQKIQDQSEFREMHIAVKETKEVSIDNQEHTKLLLAKVTQVQEEGEKQRAESIEHDKQNEDMRKFVVNLINENLISLNVIDEQIKDKSFISVFCYQKGFGNFTSEKIQLGKRRYPKIFEDLNFVKLDRIANSHLYHIIATENIFPIKLRNLDALSDYLIEKAELTLIEEWSEILIQSKQKRPRFYNNWKDKPNPLNFNILVAKTNSRDMRHKYLLSNDFNKQFNSELVSITEVNKLRVRENDKIQLRNFVLASSMKILLLGLPQKEIDALMGLENEFQKPIADGGLEIKRFYEYYTKNKGDICTVLETKFSKEKSSEYADLIMKNSKEYREYLSKLGIKV